MGADKVTNLDHTVNSCPLTKFEGGLTILHEAEDDALKMSVMMMMMMMTLPSG